MHFDLGEFRAFARDDDVAGHGNFQTGGQAEALNLCNDGNGELLQALNDQRERAAELVAGIGLRPIEEHLDVGAGAEVRALARSEEHTSELQSLMRISYAVFCLKKKNNRLQLEKEQR